MKIKPYAMYVYQQPCMYVASSMFLVVGVVCSLIRTQGCRNTTRLFNPHEHSNATQDFTTSTC